MDKFFRLSFVLLAVAAVATGILAATHQLTAPAIAEGAKQESAKALKGIFFDGFARAEPRTATVGGETVEYYAVFTRAADQEPDFYALAGKGLGYNKSVPVELLVGFANPAKKDVILPGKEKYPAGKLVCAGWKVVKSQETPGLGENARQEQADFTWWDFLTDGCSEPLSDRRTPFQRQFAGREPGTLVVKTNVDIITGATFTTNAVVDAVKDAAGKLEKILNGK